MDRQIVYPGAIPLETDLLNTNKNAMVGLSKLAAAILGTSTMLNGFAVTPTGPASLQVYCAPGEVYALTNLDGTAYSSLAADTTHQIVKQGISLDQVTLSCPAPGTAGQSINYLIEVAYQDSDANAVVLPYYNASNPSQAYSGPANAGTTQNTVRKGVASIVAKAGVAATTGSQITPAPDAGYVGAFVVTVANGQTQILAGNIVQYSTAQILPALGLIVGGLQGNACNISAAGGTADAITGIYAPGITALTNGMTLYVRAGSANATTTPSFTPASGTIAVKTIVKGAGAALAVGDIAGAGHWIELQYDLTLDKWVLLNPATGVSIINGHYANNVFYTASANLLTADVGKNIIISSDAPITLLLPPLSSVPAGAEFEFVNFNTGDAIISSAADIISIGSMPTNSLVIKANNSSRIVSMNGAWVVINNDVGFAYSPLFAASFSANGYQKLPSGLILQWGRIDNASRNSDSTVLGPIYFPVTFPNAVLSVTAQMVGGEAVANTLLDGYLFIKTVGVTSFNLISGNSASATFDFGAYWFAIGF